MWSERLAIAPSFSSNFRSLSASSQCWQENGIIKFYPQKSKLMPGNTTMFVAISMDELLDLIEKRILNGIEKFNAKVSLVQNDDFLSPDEACALLRISKVTMHKWKKKRIIRSYRIGRKIFFKRSELVSSFK